MFGDEIQYFLVFLSVSYVLHSGWQPIFSSAGIAHRPAAWASLGNLLEIQNLRPNFRHTESETA